MIMRFAKKTSMVFVGIVAALFAVPAAVGASDTSTATTYCTGPTEPGTIIVGNLQAGPGCFLQLATVEGNVTVLQGGSLDTFSSEIDGNVTSRNATRVAISLFTDVHGNVVIEGSTESAGLGRANIDGNVVLVGNAGLIGMSLVGVGGNLQVAHNSFSFPGFFSEISVGRNVDISNNTGQISIADAAITGNLICYNNQPPVIAFANTAKKMLGECAIETSP
jgi:hypothetical protein